MSATWTMKQINASYPNVLSMAQNRSTGQYMLAIVTASASGTVDIVCRAYKSSDYGVTWILLENLFSNTTPYTDGRDLNYTTLQSLNRSTLYGCAISDDGKYQAVVQKTYGYPILIWYSTDYGVMTPKNDGADDGITVGKNPNAGWKWSISASGIWPSDSGYLVKYTPGLYPVLTGTNGITIWLDQNYTRPPGSTSMAYGKIITTRDRLNAGGVEFTMDVPDMFPTGYAGTPVFSVFFITDGKVVRKDTGTVLENGANVTATIITPSGWPVSATEGGGVVVTSDNTTVYAARFVSGTGGGIWKSTNNGANWTQIQSGINVNAIGISSNGKYIIAGPRTPTSGTGIFYISSDYGVSWTNATLSFSGYINYLYITNDGMRAIGGANRTEYSYSQYSSSGYFSYTGPDMVAPNMTITAKVSGSNLVSGSTTNNSSIELTFTSTEPITGFDGGDITVNAGTLSAVTGSGSVYTATFAPGNPGAYTINVAAGVFTDSAGNYNTAASTFNFTFDNTKPEITIAATASGSNLVSGSTIKNTPILLTFTSSKATTDFDKTDISVTGGTLSEITRSGTVYSATFAPNANDATGRTECSISVAANKFIDSVGNYNTASNTFNFTFDNTKPGMTITATASGSNLASGSTTKNTPIALTFTSTEATIDFDRTDISVTGGTLSEITGSGTVYTATFAPNANDATGRTECSISVPADKFIDAVGNYNTASNTFNFTFDNTKPGMIITAMASGSNLASGSTTKNTLIALTFTSSEVITEFDKTDISFNGGTLSAIAGSGTVYSAIFTPNVNNATGKTECSISVQADKFIDSAGNYNNAAPTFNFTFDNTKPGMIITATASGSNLVSGSTTKNTPIALTFTSSEPITDFDKTDISVTGGTLSAITGSGTVYTATFAPNANDATGRTECSISVPADKFIDAVGNYNSASNTFNFTFDNTKPDMIITATASGSNLVSGSTTKNTPIALTFTSSEAITGFDKTDISVTGGTLSAVTGSGTVYSATFTPDQNDVSGKTECSISVPADKFIDTVENTNAAASTFNFTFDNTQPDMTITSSTVTSGSTTNNESIELIFTSSEPMTGFLVGGINVTNGGLTNFVGSGAVYTATFTPNANDETGRTNCSISVAANKFTDSVGNANTASNTFTWTFANTQPDITITSRTDGVTSGSTTNNESIELTFTSSEPMTGFLIGDISVTNGGLTNFDGSGDVYTATFTPNANDETGRTVCSISVAANKFTDAVGNYNTASNTFTWTFDNTQPDMTITSSTITSGSTTNNESIELIFTSSEPMTGFLVGDISVTNGGLTNFAGSGAVYTATFTPNANDETGRTDCSISVAANKFTDAVGNYNTTSNTFNWTFDSVSPRMTISSTTIGVTNGSTTKDASIELIFISTEATNNFEEGDINVTNGELTNFAGSGTVYTATLTPIDQGVCTINVAAGAYTDAATNLNNLATQFTWTFDSFRPNMTIEATVSGSTLASGSTTKDASIELRFISTEATNNFGEEDINVTNGELTNFAGSGTVYTATFTPIDQGACTINVAAGAYTDGAANINNLATQFTWTFDSVRPNMSIEATASGSTLASGSTTKNTPIALTFTSTKSTNTFGLGDISVTNGTLTNFAGSGTVYTATFTPTDQGLCTIDIAADIFIDSVGNNNTASNTFTFTFDSVRPDMTIRSTTVANNVITDDETIALTFTSTKATANFMVEDISVTNGILTNFAGSGTVYTATFTPIGGGSCTIDVAEGVFTDVAGNTNTAATRFNWSFGRTVSFDTNTLTIVKSIGTNATDLCLFVLPAGEEMSNINVTAFTGTGTITYDLSTDGASVSSGTFTGTGTNLLGTNVLIASTNTTYILTLASNASLTYTIVGIKSVNYGNVIPTALSFVNNTLTIQNIIVPGDVDKVSFDINANRILNSLEVTSLLNTNSISYVLGISGGSTVSSGSFSQAGVNLLNGIVLEKSTNTTYILTLTCGGANAYSIVGTTENKSKSAIDKYCNRKTANCNNVSYNRIVTSGNNPSISNKMRYSQLLRTQRFKTVRTYNVSVPPVKEELPLYLFSTGQIFTQSVFR